MADAAPDTSAGARPGRRWLRRLLVAALLIVPWLVVGIGAWHFSYGTNNPYTAFDISRFDRRSFADQSADYERNVRSALGIGNDFSLVMNRLGMAGFKCVSVASLDVMLRPLERNWTDICQYSRPVLLGEFFMTIRVKADNGRLADLNLSMGMIVL
jgi:hypothetical protein